MILKSHLQSPYQSNRESKHVQTARNRITETPFPIGWNPKVPLGWDQRCWALSMTFAVGGWSNEGRTSPAACCGSCSKATGKIFPYRGLLSWKHLKIPSRIYSRRLYVRNKLITRVIGDVLNKWRSMNEMIKRNAPTLRGIGEPFQSWINSRIKNARCSVKN